MTKTGLISVNTLAREMRAVILIKITQIDRINDRGMNLEYIRHAISLTFPSIYIIYEHILNNHMHEALCACMLHSRSVSKTTSNFFPIIITLERDKKTCPDLAIRPLSFQITQ